MASDRAKILDFILFALVYSYMRLEVQKKWRSQGGQTHLEVIVAGKDLA